MLSPYELQRAATIEENNAKLRELLGDDGGLIARKERSLLPVDEIARRRAAKEQRLREAMDSRRESSRLATRPRTSPAAFNESARTLEWIEPKRKSCTRKPKDKTTVAELTEEQRQTLAGASGWMEKLREFLLPQVSEANLRSVMRVVAKLASGAGSACHTKHDGHFCRGRPITMSTDLVRRCSNGNPNGRHLLRLWFSLL